MSVENLSGNDVGPRLGVAARGRSGHGEGVAKLAIDFLIGLAAEKFSKKMYIN